MPLPEILSLIFTGGTLLVVLVGVIMAVGSLKTILLLTQAHGERLTAMETRLSSFDIEINRVRDRLDRAIDQKGKLQ